MSKLSLSIDECLEWAKLYVPLYKQSRYLTDVYKLNQFVNDAQMVVKALDPKNFMFVDKDIYYAHIEMLKEIAATKNVIWANEVEHNLWIDKNSFSVHEWLKYYLNPDILTKVNVSALPADICKIILGQLKKWYETDPNIHACCLIAYLDQIHYVLMQAGSPEYMQIFNGLAAAYENTNVEDCIRCAPKSRKNKRVEKFGK